MVGQVKTTTLLIILPLAALAGCHSREQVEPLAPTATLEFLRKDPVQYGQLRETRLAVINTTIEPILIRSVTLEGQLPFCLELMTSFPGRLQEKRAADIFLYSPDGPGVTPRVFAGNLLLLPGESWSFAPVLLRARFFDQDVSIRYQAISQDVLLKNVYFPEDDPHRYNRLRYRLITLAGLGEYRRAEPDTLGRSVLIPRVDDLGMIRAGSSRVKIPIADPGTPAELIAAAGCSNASVVTRWDRRKLWIVHDPASERTVGIQDGNSPIPLPSCDFRIFDHMDTLPVEHAMIQVEDSRGQIEEIPSDAYWNFLMEAQTREEKLELDTRETARGGLFHTIRAETLP
jgi:hypothetical protein